MQKSSHEAISFPKFVVVASRASSSAHLDALEHVATNAGSRRVPMAALVSNVVLHPGLRVDLQLGGIDRSAQSRVDLPGVFVVVVAFGI